MSALMTGSLNGQRSGMVMSCHLFSEAYNNHSLQSIEQAVCYFLITITPYMEYNRAGSLLLLNYNDHSL